MTKRPEYKSDSNKNFHAILDYVDAKVQELFPFTKEVAGESKYQSAPQTVSSALGLDPLATYMMDNGLRYTIQSYRAPTQTVYGREDNAPHVVLAGFIFLTITERTEKGKALGSCEMELEQFKRRTYPIKPVEAVAPLGYGGLDPNATYQMDDGERYKILGHFRRCLRTDTTAVIVVILEKVSDLSRLDITLAEFNRRAHIVNDASDDTKYVAEDGTTWYQPSALAYYNLTQAYQCVVEQTKRANEQTKRANEQTKRANEVVSIAKNLIWFKRREDDHPLGWIDTGVAFTVTGEDGRKNGKTLQQLYEALVKLLDD